MFRMRCWLLVLTVPLLSGSLANAQDLGDPAPDLSVREWLKGKPLTSLKKGKVYIVWFWRPDLDFSTQCIPHMAQIQRKYGKKVSVIAISEAGIPETSAYLNQHRDRMEFSVGVDDDQATARSYRWEFNAQYLPVAFIINKKKQVMWFNHPLRQMDPVLKRVLANDYSVAEARETVEQRIEADRKAAVAATKVASYLEKAREGKKGKPLAKLASSILKNGKSDSKLMREFAWSIMNDPEIKDRDFLLAKKAARKAYDATGGQDVLAIDTYARALFMSGDVEAAIKYEEKAIQICFDSAQRTQFETALKEFRARQAAKGG